MGSFAYKKSAPHGSVHSCLCAGQASTLLRRAPGSLQGASYLLGNLGSPGLLAWLAPPLWACPSSQSTGLISKCSCRANAEQFEDGGRQRKRVSPGNKRHCPQDSIGVYN